MPALWAGLSLIVILLAVKMVTKIIGVWPLTRFFRLGRREGNYTTLMMSTGLTPGSMSALFGLDRGYITQGQYSILVTVVIGGFSADDDRPDLVQARDRAGRGVHQ